MKVGKHSLDITSPVVMTIVNVTPDSFFEGSRTSSEAQIARRVKEAVNAGAKIIDIGGYSSRPGADDVPEDEEIRRVMLGFEAVRSVSSDIIVSIDTFRSEVAQRVISRYGACIINDISSAEIDPRILDVVAEYRLPYIAMHSKGKPKTMQSMTQYGDIVEEIKDFFNAKISELHSKGIENIILDPGFGFAKTTEQNYLLLSRMDELKALGYPLLAGISRKSMIYKVLGTTPGQALAGTTALHWECLMRGADILRVHDTAEAIDTVRLFEYYKQHTKI